MRTLAASSLHVGLVASECTPIFRTWYKCLSTILNVTVDNDLQTFLEAVPLFSTIPRAQLQGLAAIFGLIFAEKSTDLMRAGIEARREHMADIKEKIASKIDSPWLKGP